MEAVTRETKVQTGQHANQDDHSEPSARNLSLDERIAATSSTIETHSLVALTVGLIPVPGVDVLALSGVQLNLLRKLGNFYGLSLTDQLGKKLIGAVLGAYAPVAIAAPVASVLKIVPFVGQLAGAAAVSITAGAATYALGKVFVQHFESGGTFLDFDPRSVSSHFSKAFAEGKQFVREAKEAGKDVVENVKKS
ncbi:YcjF family protein [Chitinimonas lacunae]|uniref:YcjF family protein n=1 Tax=Chitinimonas lacunae TaxID=1963018 RepID=A0ABV8MQF7_9NEIS